MDKLRRPHALNQHNYPRGKDIPATSELTGEETTE